MNPNKSVSNQDNLELYKNTQQKVLVNHEKNVNIYLEKIDAVNQLLIELEKSHIDKLSNFKLKYDDALKSNDQSFQKSQKTILKANEQKQNELLSSHRNIQKKNQSRIDKLIDQVLKLNYEYDRFDDKAKDLFQSEEKQIQKNKNKIKKILDDVSSVYYAKVNTLVKDINTLKSNLSSQRINNEKAVKQILSKHRKTSKDSLTNDFTSIIELESTFFNQFNSEMNTLKQRLSDIDEGYSKRLNLILQNIDRIDQEVKSYQTVLQDEYQLTVDLNERLQADANNQLVQLKKQQSYLDLVYAQLNDIRSKSTNQLKKIVDKSKAWIIHTDLFYLNMEQELQYTYQKHQSILTRTLEKANEYQLLIDSIQLAKNDNPLTNPIWINELEAIFIKAYRETEKAYFLVFDKLINKVELIKSEYQRIDEIEMILSFEETYKNDDFLSYKIENTKQEFIYSYAIEKAKIEHEINQYLIIKTIEDKRLELMKKSLKLELDRQINDIQYIKNIQDEKAKFDYLINIAEIKLNHELATIENKKKKSLHEAEIYKLNQEWIKVSQLNSVVYRYETKKIDHKEQLERELNQINNDLKSATFKLNQINQEREFKIENERQNYNAQKESLIEPIQTEYNLLQTKVYDLESTMVTEIRRVDHLLEESLAVPRRFIENYQIQKQTLGFTFSKLHDEAEILTEQSFSKELSNKALSIISQVKSVLNENFETIHEDDENGLALYKAYELIKPKIITLFKSLDKDFNHLYDFNRHPKLMIKLCENIKVISDMSTSLYENSLQNIQKEIKEIIEARNFSVNQIQKNQADIKSPLIQRMKELSEKIQNTDKKFNETLANVIDMVSTEYRHKENEVNKEIQLLNDIKVKIETEATARLGKLESSFNIEINDINVLTENKFKDIEVGLNEQISALEKQLIDVTNHFKESIIKSETDYKMNSNQAEKLLQQQTNQILKEILSLEKQMIQVDTEYQKDTNKESIRLRNALEDLEHQNSVNKSAYEAKSVLFKQAFEQKMLLNKREIEQIFESKDKIINELMNELNIEMTQVMSAYKEIIKNHASQLIESLLIQYINNAHFNVQMDKTTRILTIERS